MEYLEQADESLDTVGLRCPEPVMMVRQKVRHMQAGEVLFVTADDPSTKRDFANFCRFMDHQLLYAETEKTPFRYWIKVS